MSVKLKSVALVLAATLFTVPGARAAVVSVSPSSLTVTPNQSFSMGVDATDFVQAIFGGGFNLTFNPIVLRLDDITFLPSWEFFTSKGTIDNVGGHVTDVSFNTFVLPKSGGFNAATLKFTAIGKGTSNVTLSDSALFPFGDTLGNPVSVSFQNAIVSAVPEPSEMAMFLVGIGMVGWAAKRRRRSGLAGVAATRS